MSANPVEWILTVGENEREGSARTPEEIVSQIMIAAQDIVDDINAEEEDGDDATSEP